jgi:hypothetical protein
VHIKKSRTRHDELFGLFWMVYPREHLRQKMNPLDYRSSSRPRLKFTHSCFSSGATARSRSYFQPRTTSELHMVAVDSDKHSG